MKPHRFSIAPPRFATFAVPAVLAAALSASVAFAQPVPAPTPASVVNQAAPIGFSSAMEGYKPYTDDATTNWKAANDSVAQIGGWRAYAKEAAAAPEVATPVSKPASMAKP